MPHFAIYILDRFTSLWLLSSRFQHVHVDFGDGARRLRFRPADDLRPGNDGPRKRAFPHCPRVPHSPRIPSRVPRSRLRRRTLGLFLVGLARDAMDPERVRWLDYWRAPRADPPAEESGAVTRPVEAAAGSRGVRPFFVRASCVAVALTAACAGRTSSVAPPPGGPAVPSASTPTIRRGDARLGTWVWRKETVMNAKERQRLLDFAKEKGITELYVAI